MTPIRALLLAPPVAAFIALGFVAWLFLTEITVFNVPEQVSRLCLASNVAISIDRLTGLSGLKPRRFDCACAAQTLGIMYPGEKGARIADTTRQLLVNRFTAALLRSTPPVPEFDQAGLGEIRRYFDRIGANCILKG